MTSVTERRTITHFHIYCGLGGAAKGARRAVARVGNLVADFECLGGVDSDPAGCRDFARIVGVPATCLDLFSVEQYVAFHGKAPPPGWREATVADFHAAAQHRRPNVLVITAPCKGFSGLLSEKASKTTKYQALNALAFRGIWLALEAWADDPPEFVLFENVPRVQTRGRHFLDQIAVLLRSYGYVFAETTHDCGVIGGLGQSRKRFLGIARHAAKVPPFLYEPPRRPLRGVGEVIGRLPVPGGGAGGPMHRVPSLQWRTWLRLAFVEAGSDWRSLNRLRVEGGVLADYGIVPEAEMHNGVLGVRDWDDASGVVTGNARPATGSFSVADPRPEAFSDRGNYAVGGWQDPSATITSQRSPGQGRFSVADPRRHDGRAEYGQYGVKGWDETGQTVIGKAAVGSGRFTVADPRLEGRPRFNNVFRIVRFGDPSPAVAGPGGPGGGLAVADPRDSGHPNWKRVKYRVAGWEEASLGVLSASTSGNGAHSVADPRTGWPDGTHQSKLAVREWQGPAKAITGSDRVGSGALSVADPRPACLNREGREGYATQGHYGVVPWAEETGTVPAYAKHDRGAWSVADPRPAEGEEAFALPAVEQNLVCVIRALDGTWHRPFTTLELAALQSLVDPEEHFELDGLSDSAWRERIGNAVPPAAMEAVFGVIGTTLLLAWSGETFMLSSAPIWVRDVAVALAVDVQERPA